jgi:uncharacterized Ntn-hydrolase superfamily protein
MTFSIVGRCERTGQLGVAVSTAVPAVGAMCPYVRPGVGAVSTQSWVNPYLAVAALDRMAAGDSAEYALRIALETDEARNARQIGVVDARGGSASWSGAQCVEWFGHRTGPDFAVQGNMLVGESTIATMVAVFRSSAHLDLSERLLCALEAGQAAGGDKRGRQSASLLVYGTEDYPLVDLRVDEHAEPVGELRRVHRIASLQLFPFVQGMPRRGAPAGVLPPDVTQMLLKPPPQRPGGGGSGPA